MSNISKVPPKPEYCLSDGRINWKKIENLITMNFSDKKVCEITGVRRQTICDYRLTKMKISKRSEVSSNRKNKEYMLEDRSINWEKIIPMFDEKTDDEISEITKISKRSIKEYRSKLEGNGKVGRRSKKVNKEYATSNGFIDWDKIDPLLKNHNDTQISKITGVCVNTINNHRCRLKMSNYEITSIDTLNRRILSNFILYMKANPVIFEDSYHVPMTEENLIKAYEDSMKAVNEFNLFTHRDDDYSFLEKEAS